MVDRVRGLGVRRFAVLPIAVLLWAILGALALPVLKTPASTAETRLIVGDTSIQSQAVPGYVMATQELAGTYARLVTSDAMTAAIPSEAEVTATPIPNSAVVRIEASAPSPEQAVESADTAAQTLINAVQSAGGQDALARAQRALLQARTGQRQAEEKLAAASPADKAAAADDSFIAETRVRAATQVYQELLSAQMQGSTGLSVTQKAVVTSSERPKLAALGALGGAALSAVVIMAALMVRRFRSHRP